MRTCPACKAAYGDDVLVCAVDGTTLIEELELQDTMQQTRSAVMAAVAAPKATPGPIVRSNPTPGSSGSGNGSAPGVVAKGTPTPTFDSIVGATLAERYEVTRKVGEGGMGAVYEGRHLLIGKRVAIKILLDKYIEKADVVARLQQEARLASSIGHENIIDITDFGETDDGRTFVVMEYLEGEALASVIEREGALPPQRAVTITRQVASALGAAHGKGIVHRDVKPENVFITRRGDKDFVKVVDFGISKAIRPPGEEEGKPGSSPRLTQTGMVLGTPLYMSPEQARGEDDLDHRIDVYALGTILYEMLTGEVPFHGSNYLNIIAQVLSAEPRTPTRVRPDLGISPALEGIVAKAMAKDRVVRYQSMAELDADLAKIEAGVAVRPVTNGKQGRRVTQIAAWVGAVAAVVVGVALVLPRILRNDEPKAEPPPAVPEQKPPQVIVQQVPMLPTGPQPVKTIRAHVTSTPAGAEVWLGAVQKGKTPLDFDVPESAQQVTLTLKLEGFEDAPVPFFPNKDQDLPATLTKKKPERPPSGQTGSKKTTPIVKQTSSSGSSGSSADGEIHGNPYGKKP